MLDFETEGQPYKKKSGISIWLVAILILLMAVLLAWGTVLRMNRRLASMDPKSPKVMVSESSPSVSTGENLETVAGPEMEKSDLAGLIGSRPLGRKGPQILEISDRNGEILYVETTLDLSLQDQAVKWVENSGAVRAALVVMNPMDGRVLTLAGYRNDGQESNAALAGSFPAASLFKIITAAAAVEKGELNAESTVAYDGSKHTLYKGNVVKDTETGVHQATLKEGFAESINSVFGKLGAFTLGPMELADFARRFQFNQPIDFEMPVEVSQFVVDEEDPFHLAELASGFNRLTRVSPLHGAMLASAVACNGILFEPTFVSEVFDRENNIRYKSQPVNLGQVIADTTATELAELMRAAITDGTGRKQFGDATTHPVLSRLYIGGKSGTINDDEGQRVDWFVAWAKGTGKDKDLPTLALSAVVVHSGRTNITSQELIRRAILAYYQPRLKH